MQYPPELIVGLEAYGLDEKEAKVYLAGLELGSATVLELARRSDLPRTTLYPILEKLKQCGVFREGKNKFSTVYFAEAPNQLLEKMKERETELASRMPELELLQGTSCMDPGVKEYRLITSGVGLLDYVKEPYLVNRVIEERKKRGIRSRQLIRGGKIAKKIIEKDLEELRESRLLPDGVDIPATVIIFADQVAFITTRRENTMIILASGDVATTYRTLFDLVWKNAETIT